MDIPYTSSNSRVNLQTHMRESVVTFFLFCLLVMTYIVLLLYFMLLLPCFGEIKISSAGIQGVEYMQYPFA